MSTASAPADDFDFPGEDDVHPDDYSATAPRDITTAPSSRAAAPRRMAAVIPLPLPPAPVQTIHTPATGIYGSVPDPTLIPQAAAMKMTDMGIGARMVIHYTGRLAFRKSLRGGSWMAWTGTNWTEDADEGIAAERARTVITSISAEEVQWAVMNDPIVKEAEARLNRAKAANLGAGVTQEAETALARGKEAAKRSRIEFGERSENGPQHIKSAINAARPSLSVNEAAFDSHPYLVNFPNGTFDARTGVLAPHEPTDYLTKVTAANYVPTATHPDLDQILKALARTDPDLPLFLQRCMGNALLDLPTAKFFYGVKGGADLGKSTLWLAFASALGEENEGGYARVVSPKLFAVSNRDAEAAQENLHACMGARFIFADEAEKGFMDRETMTKLSSGGPFRTRGLHGKPVAWRSQATIVMVGNDFMPMPDNDAGIRRRFLGTELTHTLGEDEIDMGLAERVETREFREAILAWAVQGAMDFIRDGADREALKVTPLMEATRLEVLGGMDPLAAFWDEYVIEGAEDSFGDYVPMNTQQWFARFKQYCKAHEIKSDMTINHFSKRLTDRGVGQDKTSGKFYADKGTPQSRVINHGKFRRGIRYTGAKTATWVDLFEAF